MIGTDKKRFIEIMGMMTTVYGAGLSDDQSRVWWKLLENADIKDFEEVALAYMRENNAFMPKPGQILSLIALKDGRPTP